MPFKEGQSGNPKGRTPGSENKLTRKAKYLLNKYYDALKDAGIENLVLESNAGDKIRAILAGIPKDMNVNLAGGVDIPAAQIVINGEVLNSEIKPIDDDNTD